MRWVATEQAVLNPHESALPVTTTLIELRRRIRKPLLPLPHRDGMPRRHIAITSLRRVPNHPLQGAMPYVVITSIGRLHELPLPDDAAGLIRANHR
jgi:hypothetical protein